MDIFCLVLGVVIDFCVLLVAVIAARISYREYQSYKIKEYNELLSQLNIRYINSADVQVVVKYLRKKEPSSEIPSAYQIDLFLRFFEELGVYLKSKSLKRDDVLNFFGYYFWRFDKCKCGRKLKYKIDNKDAELDYLNEYRKLIEPYPKEWLDEDQDMENT